MKTCITAVALLLVITSFKQQPAGNSCDTQTLKSICKDKLKPFKYDSSKLTRITFKSKPQLKEIEVPLFIGEKYKIIFSTMALPNNVHINIYNKDKDSKKRELLFSSKDAQLVGSEYIFEPDRRNKVYIDYEIPAVEGNEMNGCLIFMLGYK